MLSIRLVELSGLGSWLVLSRQKIMRGTPDVQLLKDS